MRISDHTLTHQDLRQHLLNEIEASKQTIESLSDEELVAIVGGALPAALTEHGWKMGAGALGIAGVTSLAVNANANRRQAKALEKQNGAFGIK